LTDITSLLQTSYGLQALILGKLRQPPAKTTLILAGIFGIVERKLQMCSLSYQQVVHSAKMFVGAGLRVILMAIECGKKALALYKSL